MAKFGVTVGGANYEVEAPDERTAWKWANATHSQSQSGGAAFQEDMPRTIQRVAPRDTSIMDRAATAVIDAPYNAGAAVNDFAAKYVPAPFAAGLGAAANAGVEGAKMLAGGGIGAGAGALAKPALQDAARWTMQKALKPTVTDFRKGKADRAIETLLEEGANVSRGGVEKLRNTGMDLNSQVANEIANSTATVNKNSVASRLLDTEKTFKAQVDPHADLKAIDDVWTGFIQHPDLAGRASMPIQLAQELKQGTQSRLKAKYGQMGDAETEAQKALARGLREEIELGAPKVGPLNERASDIWNALNVTERRALVGGNNNPISLPAAVGAIHNPAFGAGMIVNTSDLAKSLLARGLYQGGKGAPYLGGAAGMATALRDE